MRIVKCLLPALVLASLFSSQAFAAQPDRISGAIDASNVIVLKNHVCPMARPEFDQGPVEPTRMMQVTMLFAPTAQQQQALQKLLADQQDSTSPSFHQWLTPEQFGQRFGLSQRDLDKLSAWLQGQGFKVTYVARGHDFLSFAGTAAQVETAFRTEIHTYNVNGKMHFANATPPSIPAALGGVVGAFRGLHNFFPRPMLKQHPDFTFSVGASSFTALSPGDIATIYNINPLYQMSPAINGSGQKAVIAGQTDVYLADLVNFRTAFGISTISGCVMDSTNTIIKAGACSSGNFQMVVPPAGDPGVSAGDLGESDLDIETLGGVARGAQIIFVTSANGVDDSASYAIDNVLAPVISYSYGLCEAFALSSSIASFELEYQKADAEGISFFAASGDAASATCDGDNPTGTAPPAILGPSVSYPASSAYITAVGGTELNEGSGTYWNSTNGADGGSAKSYIPELAWNDTAAAAQLDGSGGGPSNCAFGTGLTTVSGFSFEICKATAGGIPKPTWQTSLTPADSARDVPDISFSASNFNDPYIVCTAQSEVVKNSTSSATTCTGGGQTGIVTALATYNSAFGGTSASTPVAAGMAVLLNQYLGAGGLGLLNPQLYKLFPGNSSSSATSTAAFHDIIGGTSALTGDTSDNIVQCTPSQPSFEPTGLQCSSTAHIGYAAATGYDLVTGLGTINMAALFTAWPSSRTASSATISADKSSIKVGDSITLTANVTPSTAVGSVTFFNVNNGAPTGTSLGSAMLGVTANGVAVLQTKSLPGGSDSVTATYNGDAVHGTSNSAPTVVTVIAPSFALSLGSSSATVIAGHSPAGVVVTITPTNGYNQATTLSCTSPTAGVSCTFSPAAPIPDGTHPIPSTMTIATTPSMTTPVTATLTITGTNGGTITPTLPLPTFALTVNATDQSFTLTPGNANYTVTQGQTLTATLTLAGVNGFNTPVTYTCTDTVSESGCTGPSGATATTSPQFTITTTAATGQLRQPLDRGMRIFYAALLPGMLGIMFTVGSRKRSLRGMRLLGLIFVLGFSTLWLSSCSGSNGGNNSNPGTPKGAHSVSVSATTGGANPVTATATINFTVQ